MRASTSEVIIALDLATKCGWAVFRGKALIASGRWSLYKSGHPRSWRWIEFEQQLTALVIKYKASVVAYERVRRHVGVDAAHVYGGFLSCLERLETYWSTSTRMMSPPKILPLEVSTWRKAATGRGNITKKEIVRWVAKTYRYKAGTEDEAEAIAIAEAARRIRQGEYEP